MTIWDHKEDADLYESKSIFDTLKKKVLHTYSELYQWKLTADKTSHENVATNREDDARGYEVIAGKSYH